MIQCGELCRGCANGCEELKDGPLLIECPNCHGQGCLGCTDSGRVEIAECPKRFVQEIAQEINLAAVTIASNVMPVSGGVLDQAAWFVDCWHALAMDRQAIEQERQRRG